ncbi:PEP-CTERM sorting domain-containing protein [Laspinema sp. D2d]|uniref:PEP-CTERM sorting domain-containing protein n=1 Tax=Laspinema sp. D2d TaxID=2953686 RepID=UPI0021BB5209|nr:PEP-CTERM sorting domain-containing protein [Laspinema sp. D2d]
MNKTLIIGITAATAILGIAGPASAFTFGTNGISFEKEQQVKFNFVHSYGAYQSTLKVFEVLSNGSLQAVENGVLFQEVKASDNKSANNYQSTLGNAMQMVNDTFTFLANKVYTLGLVSTYNGKTVGSAFSSSEFNANNSQRAVFGSLGGDEGKAFTTASSFQSSNPFSGPVALGFEDRRSAQADLDFNDFVVTAEAVPEPLTMGGLALGAAGLAAARRSRTRRSTDAQ